MTILPIAATRRKAPSRFLTTDPGRSVRGLIRQAAAVVPFLPPKPEPVEVRVCRTPDLPWTSIYRRWRPGDSGPAGACRRCPECHAYDDGCLMIVPRIIPRAEAADYSPSADGFRMVVPRTGEGAP